MVWLPSVIRVKSRSNLRVVMCHRHLSRLSMLMRLSMLSQSTSRLSILSQCLKLRPSEMMNHRLSNITQSQYWKTLKWRNSIHLKYRLIHRTTLREARLKQFRGRIELRRVNLDVVLVVEWRLSSFLPITKHGTTLELSKDWLSGSPSLMLSESKSSRKSLSEICRVVLSNPTRDLRFANGRRVFTCVATSHGHLRSSRE